MIVTKHNSLFPFFGGSLSTSPFRNVSSLLFACALSLWPLWSFAAAEDLSPQPIQIEVVPQFHSLTVNQEYSLALKVQVEKGWHIYWKEPGRFGLPTVFQILVNGNAIEGLDYWSVPDRKMFEDGGVSYEYREPFVVLVGPFKAPSASGVLEVQVKGRWLACTVDICIPKDGEAEVRIAVEKRLTQEKERDEFSSLRESLPKMYELKFISVSYPPAVDATPGTHATVQRPAPAQHHSLTRQRLVLPFGGVLREEGGLKGTPHVAAYGGRTAKFEGGKFESGKLANNEAPNESAQLSFSSRGGTPAAGGRWEVQQIEGFLFFDEAVVAFQATPAQTAQ